MIEQKLGCTNMDYSNISIGFADDLDEEYGVIGRAFNQSSEILLYGNYLWEDLIKILGEDRFWGEILCHESMHLVIAKATGIDRVPDGFDDFNEGISNYIPCDGFVKLWDEIFPMPEKEYTTTLEDCEVVKR